MVSCVDFSHLPKYSFSFGIPNNRVGIMIDIDGVLKLGKTPIPKAKESIELLRQKNIPFVLVTNGGGEPEAYKAKVYSEILQLKPFNSLSPSEIILCHTPMKKKLKLMSNAFQKTNKLPLITGCGNLDALMESYKINNYITDLEYGIIYSHIMPFNGIAPFLSQKPSVLKRVQQRLNRVIKPKENLLGISSIFQINDVLNWEIPIQLGCDLLISKNGIPGTKRYKHTPNVVEYHLSCDEIDYIDVFKTPRLCGGSYFYCLQSLFNLQYQMTFPYVLYGKPSQIVFEYAKNRLRKLNPQKDLCKYYMIGDTPITDIKGANGAGIYSILVRTGMFKGDNSVTYPAKTVVDNVYEAIQHIIQTNRF